MEKTAWSVCRVGAGELHGMVTLAPGLVVVWFLELLKKSVSPRELFPGSRHPTDTPPIRHGQRTSIGPSSCNNRKSKIDRYRTIIAPFSRHTSLCSSETPRLTEHASFWPRRSRGSRRLCPCLVIFGRVAMGCLEQAQKEGKDGGPGRAQAGIRRDRNIIEDNQRRRRFASCR